MDSEADKIAAPLSSLWLSTPRVKDVKPANQVFEVKVENLPLDMTQREFQLVFSLASQLIDTKLQKPSTVDQNGQFNGSRPGSAHPNPPAGLTGVARFSSLIDASHAQSLLDGRTLLPESSPVKAELFYQHPGSAPIFPPLNSTQTQTSKFPPFNDPFSSSAHPHSQAPPAPSDFAFDQKHNYSGKHLLQLESTGEEDWFPRHSQDLMQQLGPSHQPQSSVSNVLWDKRNLRQGSYPPYNQPARPISMIDSQINNNPGASNKSQPNTQVNNFILPLLNPADQNPPCNTLYVGNIPQQTVEEELKELFSTREGYKRLSFKNKGNGNGPMCFVEFESVEYATNALNELYGRTLVHSVKGGIRLSFSKNPLGVRSNHNQKHAIANHPSIQTHHPQIPAGAAPINDERPNLQLFKHESFSGIPYNNHVQAQIPHSFQNNSYPAIPSQSFQNMNNPPIVTENITNTQQMLSSMPLSPTDDPNSSTSRNPFGLNPQSMGNGNINGNGNSNSQLNSTKIFNGNEHMSQDRF